jgi:chromosomal replication initiation ATPase DnaA
MANKQLAFPFAAPPAFGLDAYFVSGCNREAHDFIMRWPEWLSYGLVLTGPSGSGKTHLAHIWQTRAKGLFFPAAMLDEGFDPVLIGTTRAVVVDNAEAAPNPNALFHLMNWVKEQGGTLLLTSRESPKHWPFTLPDLRSRLLALPNPALTLPDDELITALLTKQFADRQIAVAAPVLSYLATHAERSFPAITTMVSTLDQAALEERRSISLPLAKRVLGI